METTDKELGRDFKMLIGVESDGDYLKDVTLLPSNGIAEKVILRKSPEKPSTWMAKVISISVESIGNANVGGKCREEFQRKHSFDIPRVVLNLPFFEANNLLVEIHRRVWDSKFPDSNYMCVHCGNRGTATVDLNKVDYTEEDKEKFLNPEFMDEDGFMRRSVDLTHSILKVPSVKSMSANSDSTLFGEASGEPVKSLVFRVPTLGDLINNEKHQSDEVTMWRKVAFDCLVSLEVFKDGELVKVSGDMFKDVVQNKLFDQLLDRKDLSKIREAMRENFPYLPFNHDIACGNCGEDTPIILSPDDFFGE